MRIERLKDFVIGFLLAAVLLLTLGSSGDSGGRNEYVTAVWNIEGSKQTYLFTNQNRVISVLDNYANYRAGGENYRYVQEMLDGVLSLPKGHLER